MMVPLVFAVPMRTVMCWGVPEDGRVWLSLGYALNVNNLTKDLCRSAVRNLSSKAGYWIPRFIYSTSLIFALHGQNSTKPSRIQSCTEVLEAWRTGSVLIHAFHIFLQPVWNKCTEKQQCVPVFIFPMQYIYFWLLLVRRCQPDLSMP